MSLEFIVSFSKKCSFNLDFVDKGGGVCEANQKNWDTFCEPTFFEFLVKKGVGGLTKPKSFGTLFAKIWGELGCTKVYQKFQKF